MSWTARFLCLLLAAALLPALVPDASFGAQTQASQDTLQEIKRVSKIKVSKKKLAVDVGFYIKGSPGSVLTKAQIRKQLKAVKKFANTVRFYGCAGQLTKAYKIARKMKFKIIGTAWLCGNAKEDRKELNALVRLCNQGYADVACVGSETMLRGDLSQDQLLAYIKSAKKRIRKKVPVTTADDAGILTACPAIAGSCDLLMANAYPYWGGVSVKKAVKAFDSTITSLRETYPGKEIIISETGWPTAGGRVGSAVAGGTQARRYFNDVRKWSLKNNIVVLWFDAADEPWKRASEGKTGAHWGLMTRKCRLKSCYKKAVFFR